MGGTRYTRLVHSSAAHRCPRAESKGAISSAVKYMFTLITLDAVPSPLPPPPPPSPPTLLVEAAAASSALAAASRSVSTPAFPVPLPAVTAPVAPAHSPPTAVPPLSTVGRRILMPNAVAALRDRILPSNGDRSYLVTVCIGIASQHMHQNHNCLIVSILWKKTPRHTCTSVRTSTLPGKWAGGG